jgi:hypothetical protein
VRARVVVPNLVVQFGESSWPFQVNLHDGSASIAIDGSQYTVRPLTWREKLRLARFARQDETFIQARFLETCMDGPETYTASGPAQAVLLALAMWINLPAQHHAGLALDQNQLATVTADLCRSLGVGPMAIAELQATEVEVLWQSLQPETTDDENPQSSMRTRSMPPAIHTEHTFDTKILIIPDEERTAAPQSAGIDRPAQVSDQASDEDVSSHFPVQAPSMSVPAAAKSNVTDHSFDTKNPTSTIRPGGRVETSDAAKTGSSADRRPELMKRSAAVRFRFALDPVGTRKISSPQRKPRTRTTLQPNETVSATLPTYVSEGTDSAELLASANSFPDPPIPALISVPPAQRALAAQPNVLRSLEFAEATATQLGSAEITSMLDEFCDRLAEAAADLGIPEEV